MILALRARHGSLIRAAALSAVLASLPASTAFALDPARTITQYRQSSLTSETGLPQNSVHAIAQTTDGFLWFGTEEGLARYDGAQITTYSHFRNPGLTSDYIIALAAGHDGSLWIGTDSGLTHLDTGASGATGGIARLGTFRTISAKDGLPDDGITAISEDPNGTLWVGTRNGLSLIRHGKVEPWKSGELATAQINTIATDSNGRVWIGTDGGLFRIDHDALTRWTPRDGLPGHGVRAIAPARDGSVWIGMLSGQLAVIRDNRISIPRVQLPGYEIHSLQEDRDGALWIAFDRHGIGRLYQGHLESYDASRGLPTNRITRALFEDSEGSLWIGLLDAGVVQLRNTKFAVYGKPEGLPGNYVGNVLQAHDGSMWVGTDSNGVNHLLPGGNVEVWDKSKGLPDDTVISMAQTRDDSLWVGFRRGALVHIAHGKVSVYRDPQAPVASLNALFEDREGRLWLGFYGKGIAQFEHGTFRHITDSGHVYGIAQSPDGAFWFVSDGEGVRREFHGQNTSFTSANGLPSNHVMCVYTDRDGDVWVGTASGGLTRIRGNEVVSWTPENGLPDSTVGSIIEDNQGYLWLGTDSGIVRVSKQELNQSASSRVRSIHPVLYGSADGLRSRETVYGSMPCSWKDRDGRLWFATIMGVAAVDPAHIPVNSVPPPVWIERVTLDSHVVPLGDDLRLGPSSGNLELVYTANSFVAPQQVHFRYRLVGFDHDWVSAGSRRIAWYTNVPPGRYTFEVQAANNDGVWNPTGASLRIQLRPPLSRTPVAYVLYSIIGLLVGWAVTAIRMRNFTQREKELSRVVAIRTSQLEKEKAALEATRRELDFRATHDSLTGLLNRAAVLERLREELSRAVREHAPLSVIIADLDHFKNINDTYGHLAGDDVIREASLRFRAALRDYDVVGRYGGEEFLILLPHWDASASPERINALLNILRATPFSVGEREIRVTTSMGVASFYPDLEAPDVRSILSRADTALYVAKNQGRNQASYEARVLNESESER